MKKLLYIAVAALAIAACNKNDLEKTTPSGKTLNIGLNVAVDESDTKVHFDGVDHIAFDKGENLTVAIAKEETPTTNVKLGKQHEAEAKEDYLKFKIVDPEAKNPVFSGTLWSITEDNIADKYILYSACPSSAFYFSSLTEASATVPYRQTTSQTAWDAKANALLGEPVILDATERDKTQYDEYDVTGSVSVNLAHVFGFGKISFADVPEKYAGNKVNTVVIEAVGDKKDIAGSFYIDLTKDIQFQEVTKKSSYSYIEVTPATDVTVKDAVIWFEANPGNYDVKITVKTDRCNLVYERQGLLIERRCIAAPVVHFKEAVDVVESFDVDLTGHKEWSLRKIGYSYIYNAPKEWGPDGMKMKFGLKWEGATKSNYGTSYYKSDDGTAQGFNGSTNFDGKKIILYSLASFKGVEDLYLNLGIYTRSASCDFTVALANGADTTKVKTVTVSTTESEYNADGKYYVIENATEVKDGDLLIMVDKLSASDIRPYLGSIVINPAPVVEVGTNDVKLSAAAASDKISCKVSFSKEAPVVTSDADWLTVSYADGEITYSATANEGVKRTAKIEVKINDVVYQTIAVSQKSVQEIEYKLVIDPKTMAPVLDKAKAEYTGTVTEDTYSALDFTLTATATDGSGKTIEVPLTTKQIYLEYTETSVKMKQTIGVSASIGYIEEVVLVGSGKLGTSFYSTKLAWSKDGSSYNTCKDFVVTGDDTPYTNTCKNNDEEIGWFRIDVGTTAYRFKSIEVTFVSD